ncbi:MAG: hypothetical protein K2F70_02890 [Muribaculaceae bacterium]|nr:hypothetical protein [Muribaculaceae bacterium]
MEQPYRANILIVRRVGVLPGASAEYIYITIHERTTHKKYRLLQPLVIKS